MPNPQKGRSPEVEAAMKWLDTRCIRTTDTAGVILAYIATLEAAPAWQAEAKAVFCGTYTEDKYGVTIDAKRFYALGKALGYEIVAQPAAPQIAEGGQE